MPPPDPRAARTLIASALAGALTVPIHLVATPIAAALGGVIAAAGLAVWRWSRLPELVQPSTPGAPGSVVRSATWLSLGLAVGLLVLAAIRLVIEPAVPAIGARMAAAGTLPVWRRLAIVYVAAVGEELMFRVILLSAIAGIGARLVRRSGQAPSPGVVWTANVLSALAFAAVHLPAWAGASSPGLALPMSVLALNAAVGMFLGYVFVTRGIAAAMWTHAGGDCAIQLLGPLTS
jgi:hypothetical protein